MKCLVLLLTLVVSPSAFAANGSVSGGNGSATQSGNTVLPSFSTYYRMAIQNGQADAAAVLAGNQPSDFFAQAREAVEATLGVQFQTDREAAVALIALAEAHRD